LRSVVSHWPGGLALLVCRSAFFERLQPSTLLDSRRAAESPGVTVCRSRMRSGPTRGWPRQLSVGTPGPSTPGRSVAYRYAYIEGTTKPTPHRKIMTRGRWVPRRVTERDVGFG
jgi:hypothetical protein